MQNPRAEGRHVSLYTVTLDNVPPLFPQCPSPSLLDLPSCHLLVTNIHCVDVTAGTFQICESRFTLWINVVTLADARQKRLTSSVTICVVPLSNGQKFTCQPAHLFPADAKDRAAVKARQGRGGSSAELQCGTQPPQSWPPWANFTNIAGLGLFLAIFAFRNWRDRDEIGPLRTT